MNTLFNGGRFQAQNALGPVPGALLYTYGAGGPATSSNYQATYAADGSTNTNPVVCNASGQASVRMNPSLGYRMVLKDVLGITIYDEDNISGELFGLSSNTGAGQVGFSSTSTYATGTLGSALEGAINNGAVNVWTFLTPTQLAQVQGNTTSFDLTTAINTAKSFAGNRPLYFPAGTYAITTLSFIGNLGGIIGEGIGNTILKVFSTVTTALDFNETTDTNPQAFILRGFTLDGNNTTTNGINVRYRHGSLMDCVQVMNCTNGIVEKETYVARHSNVRTHLCVTGWTLVGSNHSSTYIGCTFDQNSGTQLLVQTNGPLMDGNSALTFIGCDVEFGSGTSIGADLTCSDITFLGCYLGEGIPGSVLTMRSGICTIKGGAFFWGDTALTWGITPLGGNVMIENSAFNGQTFGNLNTLIGGGVGGKVKFTNFQFNGLVSGTPFIVGDSFDYGSPAITFAPRLGKQYTGQGNNLTLSSVVSGNKQTFTALTAPGPTPLLGAKATLIGNSGWRDGENLYLMLVYESSRPINVLLSASPFGGSPTKALKSSYPATSGTPNTAIAVEVAADNAAYTLLEITQQVSSVGDTLVIYECFLADSRMLDKGASQIGNLYKC